MMDNRQRDVQQSATCWGKTESKPAVLRLKNWPCVACCSWRRNCVNTLASWHPVADSGTQWKVLAPRGRFWRPVADYDGYRFVRSTRKFNVLKWDGGNSTLMWPTHDEPVPQMIWFGKFVWFLRSFQIKKPPIFWLWCTSHVTGSRDQQDKRTFGAFDDVGSCGCLLL